MSPASTDTWHIEFFADEDGSFPVRAWLDSLPEEVRVRVLARIDLLKTGGPTLDFPYTSQIEGKLREARLRVGKTRYRVPYFFDEARTAILLHGFTRPELSWKKLTNRSDERGWHGTRPALQTEVLESPKAVRRARRKNADEDRMGPVP